MLTNLPNLLTLSRIGVIPILAVVIYVNQPATRWIALALFTLAGITDYFDGYLARNRGQVSESRLRSERRRLRPGVGPRGR